MDRVVTRRPSPRALHSSPRRHRPPSPGAQADDPLAAPRDPSPSCDRRMPPPEPPLRVEPSISEMGFPGCVRVPMKREGHLRRSRPIELWDAGAGAAWRLRDGPGPAHEAPGQTFAQLVERISAVRGKPIRCFGTTGLVLRRGEGEGPGLVPHPDQIVYLGAQRPRPAGGHGLLVDGYSQPDVVLEVDHTTDVRRGKLRLYESWGVPELWVEVPDEPSRNRPAGLRPGLTIHLLDGGIYRRSPVSRAFPGWMASDAHAAMNEIGRSARTSAILEQVGRRLGERSRTGPDDDPLMRSLREESRAEGRAEGRSALVRQLLRSRGMEVSEAFPADVPGFERADEAGIVAAALACDDERDFRARIRGS